MSEWLQTYNEFFGMYHAGIITSIFGAFAVTFTVLMSWPKLVKDFGPIGGFMAAALIIGTFWVVNHKLPGFGFSTGLLNDAEGLPMQFSLIHQGNRGSAPWVDGMGDCNGIYFVRRTLRTERNTWRTIERSISPLAGDYSGWYCRRYFRRTYRIHECGTLTLLTEKKKNHICIY